MSGLIDNNFGSRDWEYRALDDLPRGWDYGGLLIELDQAGIKELMCQYIIDYELFEEAQKVLKKEVIYFINKLFRHLTIVV